jgi:hypothetical protein
MTDGTWIAFCRLVYRAAVVSLLITLGAIAGASPLGGARAAPNDDQLASLASVLVSAPSLQPQERERVVRYFTTLDLENRRDDLIRLNWVQANTPNLDRVLRAYGDMGAILSHHAHDAGVLSDPNHPDASQWRRTVIHGIAVQSTGHGNGMVGVLGRRQATNALRGWLALEDSQREELITSLRRAKRPDGYVYAEALILKALGARVDSFREGGNVRSEGFARVTEFATDITRAAESDEELVRTSTLVDLFRGDNSHRQRVTMSCVPAVAEMARGVEDPFYARWMHTSGSFDDQGPRGVVALEQVELLMNRKVTSMWDRREYTYAPGQTEVRGTGFDAHGRKIANWLSPRTGLGYYELEPEKGSETLVTARMERELRDGKTVPLGVDENGNHQMLAIDARRAAGGERTFLIADPWDGTTKWRSESDLIRSLLFINRGERRRVNNLPIYPVARRR